MLVVIRLQSVLQIITIAINTKKIDPVKGLFFILTNGPDVPVVMEIKTLHLTDLKE